MHYRHNVYVWLCHNCRTGGLVQQLNLNLLSSLLALLQERNVSRAALLLHVSQSALSRQLAHLRDYFADPLLVRVGNGYVLTPKAEQLLPRIQALVNQLQDLRQSEVFDPSQCQRRFRFAATSTLDGHRISPMAVAIFAHHGE